jgi:hypothetical protein
MQMQQQAHLQQRQQQQQRAGGPQPGGNPQHQVHAAIFQGLTNQPGPLSGWQSQIAINERAALIYNV